MLSSGENSNRVRDEYRAHLNRRGGGVLWFGVRRSWILGRLRSLSMHQLKVILCGLCMAFSADTICNKGNSMQLKLNLLAILEGIRFSGIHRTYPDLLRSYEKTF